MAQAFDPYHKWLGIPPAEQPPNHYRLLGLTLFESDPDVILSAAEQRIVHVRTFQISEHAEASQRILNELAAARVCLLSPQKRAAYDAQLRRRLARPQLDIGNYAQRAPAIQPLRSLKAVSPPRQNRTLLIGAVAVIAVLLTVAAWYGAHSSRRKAIDSERPQELADATPAGEATQLVGSFQPNPPAPEIEAPAPPQQPPVSEPAAPQPTPNPPPPSIEPATAPASASSPPAESAAAPTSEAAPMPPVSSAPTPTPPPPAPPAGPSVPAGPPPAVAPFNAQQAKQHQEAWAKHLGLPVIETNSIGMQMVLIPPGEFEMGSSQEEVNRWISTANRVGVWERGYDSWADELGVESPKHHVIITSPFWMSAHEVTVGDFRKYLRARRDDPDYHRDWDNDVDYPLDGMPWEAANDFCRWLCAESAQRYRLPSEAEWEYACRAGTVTTWYFGADEAAAERHSATVTGGRVDRIGGKPPNAFGLYEMNGSLTEWCADWFAPDYYRSSAEIDPVGPPAGKGHVIRDGQSQGKVDRRNKFSRMLQMRRLLFTRSAHRYMDGQMTLLGKAGFRVVREIEATPPSGDAGH